MPQVITADQLILHGIGDYVLQSHWMATEKTRRWTVAIVHALVYSLPFLLLGPSVNAWLMIFGTHAIIDRLRFARYIVWAKNWMGPNRPWAECSATGYSDECPFWLAGWLMIAADNICHIMINGIALKWL